jgi:NADP-dependent 3-hydroxy acid dehydrogenase YdfG
VALGRNQETLDSRVKELTDLGGDAFAVEANVMNIESLENASKKIIEKYGKIDILLNIAGGNIPSATLSPEQSFFDMNISGWDEVTDLNINGTVYPSYVFGKVMAEQKKEVSSIFLQWQLILQLREWRDIRRRNQQLPILHNGWLPIWL